MEGLAGRYGCMKLTQQRHEQAAQTRAITLTFDDLTTRDTFVSLGIESTYQGFEWGYSIAGGLSNAVIPSNSSTLVSQAFAHSKYVQTPPYGITQSMTSR